ncbi:MAG: class D beta-lactamase [Chloroflexi bacterium]|nr:class D beta-lactamase [Chloroflexota bacterium]
MASNRQLRTALWILLALASLCACTSGAVTPETPSELNLDEFFDDYDKSCFVTLDVTNNQYSYHNPEQCAKRMAPCSTFKIPNSLIGLETGVIPDQYHVIAWDEITYPVEAWNQDHTLETAIRDSVVWYYRELAAQVGTERMQQHVSAIPYGNEDVSGGPTFWLASSLEISADEQIEFLRRFHADDLPFSQRSLDIVKEIITLEATEDDVYRGKTGSCMAEDGREWGWFVGYIERSDTAHIFALNIEGNDIYGWQARKLAETILEHLGLFQFDTKEQ